MKLNLQNVIEEAFFLYRMVASEKSIEILVSNERNTFVYADKEKLVAVIGSFLSNAIKFSENDSVIEILTKVEKRMVEVSVSDSGIGIHKEKLKQLFLEKKQNTNSDKQNSKDTCKGLILCKKYIEDNGGKVWVKSEPGVGTIFTFTVPLYTEYS